MPRSSPPSPRAAAWVSILIVRWMRERLAAAGGDPSEIPDVPLEMWRLPEVKRRTSLSRASIYRLAALGQFPKPVSLSAPTSSKAA